MKRRYMCMIVSAALALTLLTGCQKKQTEEKAGEAAEIIEEEDTEKTTDKAPVLGGNIGISFPTKDDSDRKAEALELQRELEDLGYDVQIQYAGNDGEKQAEQLTEMIKDKVNCLVILPVNSEKLENPLKQAGKQGITVISYDSLIIGSDKISYYVGYDDETIGKKVGEYIAEEKQLANAKKEKKSYTIEFFMGALNDGNSQLRLKGIIGTLEPYFGNGVLESRSLRTEYADTSIAKASIEIAEKTCDNIMKANYLDKPVDIVCAGSDALAGGIVSALQAQSNTEENWPVVTGADGTDEALLRIAEGTQAMTVYKTGDSLVDLCTDIIDREIQGEKQKNLGTCNNGSAEIPAAYAQAEVVTEDNCQQIMKSAGITVDTKDENE